MSDGNESSDAEDKKTSEKPTERLGDYAIDGGPGRPKGSKNKFTKIKEEIVSLWHDAEMKKALVELIKKDPKEARAILSTISSLLPKTDDSDVDKIEELPFTVVDDPEGK